MITPLRVSTFAVLAAFFAFTGTATATDRHASPSGSGTACTIVSPCDLVEAVNSATTGDDVFVAPGDYTLASTVVYVAPGIDVIGSVDDPSAVTVTGNLTPRMLEVQGTLRGMEFVQSATSGAVAWVTAGGQLTNSILRVSAASGAAVGCYPQQGLIRDSVCVGRGYAVRAGFGNSSSQIDLRNVTAIGTDYGLGIDSNAGSNTVVAKSSIFQGNSGDVIATASNSGDTTTLDAQNSIYQSTTATGPGTVTLTPAGSNGNLTDDPIFVDEPGGDYRQAVGSPTINAGVADGLTGTLDLDGVQRIQGSAVDIGAYEADGIAPSAPSILAPTSGTSSSTVAAVSGTAEAGSTVSVTVNGTPAGGAIAGAGGDWNLALASPLANGTFTIAARAADLFGNTSAAGEVTVVLDSVAPKVKLLSKPKKKGTKRKAKFTFRANEASTFQCKLDKGKFKTCKSPFVKKVKSGRHTFQIVAVDKAGNKSDPVKFSWNVKSNVVK